MKVTGFSFGEKGGDHDRIPYGFCFSKVTTFVFFFPRSSPSQTGCKIPWKLQDMQADREDAYGW